MDTSGDGFVCPVCGPAPSLPADRLTACGVCDRAFTRADALAAALAWQRQTAALPVVVHHGPLVPAGHAEPSGLGSRAHAAPEPDLVVVLARSAVLAVLMSAVWPGAGHLYARRAAGAVAFAVAGMLLWAGGPRLVAVPFVIVAWVALVAVAAITSARAARTAPGTVYRG